MAPPSHHEPVHLVIFLVYPVRIMREVTVRQAKTHLSRLLREVVKGEEVVISRSGRPVARLVPVAEGRPVFGVDEGRFVVPEDFDEPLDEDLVRVFSERFLGGRFTPRNTRRASPR